MSTSANANTWLCQNFDSVDLQALNAKAEMLERLDNKYVVEADVMEKAAAILARNFDILEIDGLRSFTYETCYFDGAQRQSYFDHHQGRRKRAKVRMRNYADAALCFVEVKLKDRRGITVKKRLRSDTANFGLLDGQALDHVDTSYRGLYRDSFPYELSRVLDMRYKRMTLVAKDGGERMTIDGQIQFFANGTSKCISDGLFILETKSSNGNGLADRILRNLHQHPTKHCSKYCAGMIFMNEGLKHNKFKPMLRRLGGLSALPEYHI